MLPFLDLDEGSGSTMSLELEALNFLVRLDIDLNLDGMDRDAKKSNTLMSYSSVRSACFRGKVKTLSG
jgi:hypothetical protein